MNVLVLTDLSKVAKNAGEYAVRFLNEIPVNFYLLNVGVFNKVSGKIDEKKKTQIAINQINERIDELKLISNNSQHLFTANYSEENLINATRRFVEEKKIDLIIMGAPNKRLNHTAIIGNFTNEIIKKIKCNLLAIPENKKFTKPDKLIIPVESSAAFDVSLLSFLNHSHLLLKPAGTLLILGNKTDCKRDDQYPSFLKEKFTIEYSPETKLPGKELMKRVNDEFDLIILMAKNLRVCNHFLNARKDMDFRLSNRLPILILHK
ncbi:universal stress protein [Salegentibacter salegens]|uniref:Nucleotide-binding universal stress protein, UspA family n=1 Tax=Salegentibacter salegens TaxID=143223 RepID=A0A1M7L4W1_9FLAO|nr:universal stress protein [Salegentibacter salegens]PRX38813.1 nucleotide-binding universal stress UspA family protein [Salegentibacter salegens]SHM72766.1 Nucleotide-binding universal stress protein, UspA family [Salegentibacter salegens]SHM72923.1 Nucleotide-binding universal stress protein, UspA family [Salegentibacter salegens]